ncbi:MAG: glutathione-regulated potassium-efflux system protein KefB [Deltaproteobacteria bacterium RBG_16_71_12]|nr:MAG: glutathione-regulated potassium-efflux system protein KefB [Deltaproteobacteria bacterium RBG_16_71_12]
MSVTLLQQAIILLAAACVAVPLFKRFKLGAILGYLVAGVAIGPHALGFVEDGESVLHFSELGVVFFLFLVGLELEPKRLWELRRDVFGLGSGQLLASAVVLGGVIAGAGVPPAGALVAGFGLALSSTAIALQLLAERGQSHAPAGRAGFAILLFQDVAVIPMLAIIPLLAGSGAMSVGDSALAVAKAVGLIALIVVGGRYVTRPLFRAITAAHAHEVNVALALLIVIGAGALMSLVGLSMGMGAFLAGMLLADSEYRHDLEANVEPFKGLLLGLFFIAVGMMVDVHLFVERPLVIVVGVLGLLAAKTAVMLMLGRVAGWDLRGRTLTAVAMSQGGEFAFVLFGVAGTAGVLEARVADLLVVIVSASMAATPLAMLIADRVLRRLTHKDAREFDALDDAKHPVIVAGFGRYGQIVARVLGAAGHRYIALDASPEHIDFVRKFGNKAYYGDASRLDLLRAARADQARAFVLAIDDVEASVRTAATVRRAFPGLPIFARARNRDHAYRLMDLGVETLNRETFWSALKMAEEVLVSLGMTREDAQSTTDTFQRADHDILRRQHQVHHDPEALMQAAKDSRAELQAILAQDAARRAGPAPAADGPPSSPSPPSDPVSSS